MPATIFGKVFSAARARGGMSYKQTGAIKSRTYTSPATPSKTVGRQGASPHAATDAASDSFQFSTTYAAGAVDTRALTQDGDYVSMIVGLAVTATGNTATVDILNALSRIDFIAKNGPVISLVPNPDFYQIAQRFSEYHTKPTVAQVTGATQVSATYKVDGINMPETYGPYSIQITVNSASGFSASTTALSVVFTLSFVIGTAPKLTRYVFSGFPVAVSANGTSDLSPVAAIQDIPLVELFISGLTSNTADISFLELTNSQGAPAPRITATDLVARANSMMVTNLDSDKLFPLMAMGMNLTLSRTNHTYFNWGATPSSTIRLGFYWLE